MNERDIARLEHHANRIQLLRKYYVSQVMMQVLVANCSCFLSLSSVSCLFAGHS